VVILQNVKREARLWASAGGKHLRDILPGE
jgi:hypothetical protein